jgi:hypothetical protein
MPSSSLQKAFRSPGHNQDNEKARPTRERHSAVDAGRARTGNGTGELDLAAIPDVLRAGAAEDEHVTLDEILLAGWSGGGGVGYPQEGEIHLPDSTNCELRNQAA